MEWWLRIAYEASISPIPLGVLIYGPDESLIRTSESDLIRHPFRYASGPPPASTLFSAWLAGFLHISNGLI